MFRGTTPTLYFKINNIEDLTTIKELNITFKTQANKYCCHTDGRKMIKTLKDVTIDTENNTISLDLTQLDTLSFKAPLVYIQIKFLFEDDKVCASTICELPIENPLDERIMEIKPEEPDEPDDGGDEEPENPSEGGDGEDTPTDPEPETPDEPTDPDTPDPDDETPDSNDTTGDENP